MSVQEQIAERPPRMFRRIESAAKGLGVISIGLLLGAYFAEVITMPQDTGSIEDFKLSDAAETIACAGVIGGLAAGGILLGMQYMRKL